MPDDHFLIVYKLDHEGREVWQYPARVLGRTGHAVRLEAYFDRDDTDLGYAVFRRGDRFVEYYYADRWYNIFAVYDGGEVLKGWYCNICRPAALEATAVRCEDLALDLWFAPDGSALLLDEDEFAALPLTTDERAGADDAVRQLRAMAARATLPR